MPRVMARRQRGAAALLAVLLLCALATLTGLCAHRALIDEERHAAMQWRAVQAFHAADAALPWALAQLHAGRVDGHCAPSADPAEPSLRDRLLRQQADGRLVPRTDADGAALHAGCVLDGEQWRCGCTGMAPPPQGVAPAFDVQLAAAAGAPGLLRLQARGCVGCGDDALNAQARAEWLLAPVAALAVLPTAALTARGPLRLDPPLAPVLVARDGLLLHGRAAVDAGAAALLGRPGAAPEDGIADQDDTLPADAARFFQRLAGLAPAAFADAPGVWRVACAPQADCAEALGTAVRTGARLLWVEGDLALPAGAVLGRADAPVLLAVGGTARLEAGFSLHGLLLAGALDWHAAAGDGVRGAVVVNGGCCQGSGTPRIEHDAALLARLSQQAQRLVPVPGSWKDFE